MTPCRAVTPFGPCARPAGHTTGWCLDVAAYAASLVEERRRIVETAEQIGCIAHGRGMRGIVALVGPAGLRRSVWLALLADIDRDHTLFGRSVAELFELEVPATALPAQRDLRSFVAATVPELARADDPAAGFTEHLSGFRKRGAGAAVLVVDDVAGLAGDLVEPEVLAWLEDRSREMPLMLGSTMAGFDLFQRHAAKARLTRLVDVSRCCFEIRGA